MNRWLLYAATTLAGCAVALLLIKVGYSLWVVLLLLAAAGYFARELLDEQHGEP